ncbi:hypothetical protein DFH07DRAFT_951754 [Mycena maculata]|uniref:Uncharacterized protein n=1 Tax=Mycena maculata TaxID=230809 RepID=A0AAD7K217_9AGAR|nr:hypothetical protein DFH07DRAFT_951754 [Mycena maculata]
MPLLATSPKHACLSTPYIDFDRSSSPIPTLSTAMATPFPAAGPAKRLVGRPQKPLQMNPAVLATPLLQGLPQSPVLVKTTSDRVVTKGNWSVEELSTFYKFCLGQDADSIFQKITMSSKKCWKTSVGKVGVSRDARQLKSQWDVSLAIYKKLVPLLRFTGGGADANAEPDWDEKDAVDNFLKSRAVGGHDVEGLSAKKVKQWLTSGWFDLFNNRYSENPKAVREIPCSSADTLSDVEAGFHADDKPDNRNDSDDDIVEPEKPIFLRRRPRNRRHPWAPPS